MLRVELTQQLLRLRTMIALVCLAAVPVIAGLTTASSAGRRNGSQGGLFGASTFSALNHAAASLEFIGPLLLPIVVALLASAIGAADRDWGTLRYLYVQPVNVRRLITGKLLALVVSCLAATGCVLAGGLLTGLALFGWHRFHLIGAANLSSGTGILRFLEASGYTAVCMMSIAAIAFALAVALPNTIEALAVSIAFVVVASILNGQQSLHALNTVLPVHYWQNWTHLFDSSPAHLGPGLLDQLATILVAVAIACTIQARRDPAA